MSPPALDALRRARAEGRLLLFLGADLPREATGLPSRAELARGLAARHSLAPHDSLAVVAQRVAPDGQRHAVTQYLIEQLARPGQVPAPLHTRIAALGLPAVVTTTYDDLLNVALERRGALQIVRANTDLPFLQRDLPCLIRLYGDLLDKRSLVVTEADQERLLEERRGVAQHVSELMRSHVVLFIGEGFGDILVRRLRRELLRQGGDFAAPAFAACPGIDEQQRLDLLGLAVTPIDLDPAALIEQLFAAPAIAPAEAMGLGEPSEDSPAVRPAPRPPDASVQRVPHQEVTPVSGAPASSAPKQTFPDQEPAAASDEQVLEDAPRSQRDHGRESSRVPWYRILWGGLVAVVVGLATLTTIPANLAQIFGSPFQAQAPAATATVPLPAVTASPPIATVPSPPATVPPTTPTAPAATSTTAALSPGAQQVSLEGVPIIDFEHDLIPYDGRAFGGLGTGAVTRETPVPGNRIAYRLTFDVPKDGGYGYAGMELVFREMGEDLSRFGELVVDLSLATGTEGCRIYLREVSELPPDAAPSAYFPLTREGYADYQDVKLTPLVGAGLRRRLVIPLRYFARDERGAPVDLARIRLIGISTNSRLTVDGAGFCQLDALRFLR